jgi:Dioxygenase
MLPPIEYSLLPLCLLRMARLASFLLLCILAFDSLSWAHPGDDHNHEATERAEYLRHNARSLTHCAAKLKSRGNEAANLKRRQALAEELREKRGLESRPYFKARDLDSVLNKSHLSNQTGISRETAPQDLFSDNSSCILQPDVTEGPYYVSGELIRTNITDGEGGIPLALDIQIIDSTTCEPVPAIYLDIWHCNATGVYSGVVANGNGDSSDLGNLNNTAFRGLQKTDNMGIVQFETMFPGHYAGETKRFYITALY